MYQLSEEAMKAYDDRRSIDGLVVTVELAIRLSGPFMREVVKAILSVALAPRPRTRRAGATDEQPAVTEFSRSYIIDDGSSPSRCGPVQHARRGCGRP
jgi:hypothetical protein